MVVPHRPAVLAAKQLADIDIFSNGRLTVGIGAGWMQEEFEALGVPDFAERGKVTDEYLDAFVELWTKDAPAMNGKYTKFSNIDFSPKPVQTPHPPIWIGGESGPALRRVARIGDGWYPIGTNPQFPLDSLPRLRAGIGKMRDLVKKAGRNPDKMTIAFRIQRFGDGEQRKANDGERALFSGSMAEAIADLRALKELGVAHVDCGFPGQTPEAVLERMQAFRTDVLWML
jgi:probable F420-dependent oxidoreductase